MAKLDYGGEVRPKRLGIAWLPPFVAGAVAAIAAELAAGLLLYSGTGFLRALTIVLAVEMGAFALGLWSAYAPEGRGGGPDWVRRRWLFALTAYTAAAGFSVLWSVLGATSRPAWQGVGLALLGGLPLFSIASLLGAMERTDGPRGRLGGAAAALGASVGFLATGFLFVPVLEPSSILLICVIGLSAGALLHGWIWNAAETATVLESKWTARGEVRVEDRTRGISGARRRFLIEAGRVRGAELEDGSGLRAWEAMVLEGLPSDRPAPVSVLLYGAGAGTLSRRLMNRFATLNLVAVEPSDDVWRLARAYFPVNAVEPNGAAEGPSVHVGVPIDEVAGLRERSAEPGCRFDLAIVDLTAFAGTDPVPALPPASLEPLSSMLARDGVVLLGPLDRSDEGRQGLEAWLEIENGFPLKRTYRTPAATLVALSGGRPESPLWTPPPGAVESSGRRSDPPARPDAAPIQSPKDGPAADVPPGVDTAPAPWRDGASEP